MTDSQDVCAIYWHDYGLGNRWYEVAHFLDSLDACHRIIAVGAYQHRSGLTGFSEWDVSCRYGVAIDYIICASFVVRHATSTNHES